MKTRAVLVFAVLLLLATLAAESDAISGNVSGKRALKEDVRQLFDCGFFCEFFA